MNRARGEKIGDEQFWVEWCSHLVTNDQGELEPDLCEYSVAEFPTIADAIAFGKTCNPECGEAMIVRYVAVLVDYGADGDRLEWEADDQGILVGVDSDEITDYAGVLK